MSIKFILEIAYTIAVILVCLKVIYDTRDNTKTLGYLLVVIFVPVFGILLYFTFGINYRKNKIYSRKLIQDENLENEYLERQINQTNEIIGSNKSLKYNKEIATLLLKGNRSALTANNNVKLLINGEEKFPEVIDAIKNAKHHIHIEYFRYEDDFVGREIEDLLEQKAKEGVTVRVIYDDYGSRTIRKTLVPRMREKGIEVFPFHKITFVAFANRLNYRNHRKIIVIDGVTAFVGGINISDKYINCFKKTENEKPAKRPFEFWRDTHVKIEGPGVHQLQYIFLCDWNFSSKKKLQLESQYFPDENEVSFGDKIVQIATSGPDSQVPTVLYSMLQAINIASKEILITTPYFIPNRSVMDALLTSALGGVKIKMIIPGLSDSKFVNAAMESYLEELLVAGIEIYRYKKGFIHAKTLVSDRDLSIVGTANMDIRSFDLNFEVNAVIYDKEFANQLADVFQKDISHTEKINLYDWQKRTFFRQFYSKIAGLVSPLL